MEISVIIDKTDIDLIISSFSFIAYIQSIKHNLASNLLLHFRDMIFAIANKDRWRCIYYLLNV